MGRKPARGLEHSLKLLGASRTFQECFVFYLSDDGADFAFHSEFNLWL